MEESLRRAESSTSAVVTVKQAAQKVAAVVSRFRVENGNGSSSSS
jgi:hypothetical protein